MVDEAHWDRFLRELAGLGVVATTEEILDADWCSKKIASLGYSLQITAVTPWSYRKMVEAVGKMGVDSEHFKHTIAQIEAAGAMYTYQLQGPLYPERGRHVSPVCTSITEAAAVALYNLVTIVQVTPPANDRH